MGCCPKSVAGAPHSPTKIAQRVCVWQCSRDALWDARVHHSTTPPLTLAPRRIQSSWLIHRPSFLHHLSILSIIYCTHIQHTHTHTTACHTHSKRDIRFCPHANPPPRYRPPEESNTGAPRRSPPPESPPKVLNRSVNESPFSLTHPPFFDPPVPVLPPRAVAARPRTASLSLSHLAPVTVARCPCLAKAKAPRFCAPSL